MMTTPSWTYLLWSTPTTKLFNLHTSRHPDITFAVQHLVQQSAHPAPCHYVTTKCVVHYLHGTQSLQIHLGNPKVDLAPHTFSDSDWAGCLSNRLSMSGYVWFFYGGPVTHASKKQVMHALSTTKAKYMALSTCVQEGLWLKSFIHSIHQSLFLPLHVHADNTAAISLAVIPSNHSNPHHINTCFHFIHEHVDCGVFELC